MQNNKENKNTVFYIVPIAPFSPLDTVKSNGLACSGEDSPDEIIGFENKKENKKGKKKKKKNKEGKQEGQDNSNKLQGDKQRKQDKERKKANKKFKKQLSQISSQQMQEIFIQKDSIGIKDSIILKDALIAKDIKQISIIQDAKQSCIDDNKQQENEILETSDSDSGCTNLQHKKNPKDTEAQDIIEEMLLCLEDNEVLGNLFTYSLPNKSNFSLQNQVPQSNKDCSQEKDKSISCNSVPENDNLEDSGKESYLELMKEVNHEDFLDSCIKRGGIVLDFAGFRAFGTFKTDTKLSKICGKSLRA